MLVKAPQGVSDDAESKIMTSGFIAVNADVNNPAIRIMRNKIITGANSRQIVLN